MLSTTKPWPSAPQSVHNQGGGSGQIELRAGGAKNLWVKKSRRKRVDRLKIAPYNIITLLRNEHIHELRRREECFTSLQSGHLLCQSKENNGRSRLSHKSEMERKYNEGKQHQPHSNKTCCVHSIPLQTKDNASICNNINGFYNDVDRTLGKPNHYTVVMGDFNAQLGNRTNHMANLGSN